MKSQITIGLAFAGMILSGCSTYNPSIHNQRDSTAGEVSELLGEASITTHDGKNLRLELWPVNFEYVINDPNCSIDPSETHRKYLPEDHDQDSVTACLYEDSGDLGLDLGKHDI